MKLSPYREYKDSGLPWLGKIPAHWEMRRNGRLFAQRVETGFPGLSILEVSLRTGVRVRDLDDAKRKQLMSNREQYKRAARGDIAYNMMRMWQGAVGVVPTDGLVSPAYVVARPFPETDGRYYSYLFRTAAYMNEINKYSRGIVTDRNRLYWDEFKQMPSAFPPLGEQRNIADVLDSHDRTVRRFIRAKRRLIELLNKQRQAVIHRAVTRGLDPNVRLKPSGVEWLGDVPEDWEIKRIKDLARPGTDTFTDGDWIEAPYITDRGIRLIQTGNVGTGRYKEQGYRYISEATFSAFNCTEVRPGDILICRLGEPVARACLAPELGCRLITSVDVCILKPAEQFDPKFLVCAMSNRAYLDWVGSLCRGSTRDRVSRSMLGGFRIPVPPHGEQESIRAFLEVETKELEQAIQAALSAIDLIREYRARLIADVVTGKLDVRGVELPALLEVGPVTDYDDTYEDDSDDIEPEETDETEGAGA